MPRPCARKDRRAFSALSLIVSIVLAIIFATSAVLIYLNRAKISDYYTGLSYAPSEEMASLRDSLSLTSDGLRIFNASHPTLNSKEEFNNNCESYNPNIAIYGCYRDGRIYIYGVKIEELPGFQESTLAHELLHAVWERLSESEKNTLIPILESTYSEHESELKESVENYPEAQLIDELYVRIAVQLKDIPDSLETHYSKTFSDRAKIVAYYDSYITPFNKLNAEISAQKIELDHLHTEIDSKTRDYEQRSVVFSGSVAEFNSCAATPGCYSSQYTFNADRAKLVSEQESLDSLYAELETLIDTYNEKVAVYNDNVLLSNTLQAKTNSNAPPADLAE